MREANLERLDGAYRPGISAKDLSEAAGVSLGTAYNYLRTKAAAGSAGVSAETERDMQAEYIGSEAEVDPAGKLDLAGIIQSEIRKEVRRILSKQGKVAPIAVQIRDLPPVVFESGTHAEFAKGLRILRALGVLWLVGPTGSGKTHLGEQLAKACGLSFASYSCTQGMAEGKLEGRLGFGNVYLQTAFVQAYENGGVILLDEFDALNDNVRLLINSAIANGHIGLPNRVDNPQATRHPDFYLIIGTNTFGQGSTSAYTGRDTIDQATQDRFAMAKLYLDYDAALETRLLTDMAAALQVDLGDVKAKPVQAAQSIKPLRVGLFVALDMIRAKISGTGLTSRAVSTRSKLNGAKLRGAGFSDAEIMGIFLTGWSESEISQCCDGIYA